MFEAHKIAAASQGGAVVIAREGNYPPPARWPALLTREDAGPVRPHPMHPLIESAGIVHSYVADGWPGSCSITFRDGKFYSWSPALTVERAEKSARSA